MFVDLGENAERMKAVQSAAVEVARRYDRKYWLACIAEDRQPVEFTRALAESGLLGIGLAEEFGGQGGGLLEEVTLVETLGKAGLPSTPFAIANFTRSLVAKHGSDEQRKRFIPRTLTGETHTCFAMTESDSGTNALAMRTRADRDGDGWRVNGRKVYISAAGIATQMLLVARTNAPTVEGRTSGLSLFMLDLPQAGISMTPMRITVDAPEHQYEVYFDDVKLPADALVGAEGGAMRCLFSALNPERILVSAMMLGVGDHLLNKAVAFARERSPFGRPIGSYQAVQHQLARAFVDLEAARLMTYQAARDIDRGEAGGIASNAAKLLASEAAQAAVDVAIQVHGGQAFDHDTDVIAFYDFVRLHRIAPINNEMVLNFIGERALGLPRSY